MAARMIRSSIRLYGSTTGGSIFSPSSFTSPASFLPLRSFSSIHQISSSSSSSSSFRPSFSFSSSFPSSSSSSLFLSPRRFASSAKTEAVASSAAAATTPAPAAVPVDATTAASSIDVQSLASSSDTLTTAATAVVDHWWNVNAAHSILESFHDWLGVPWWGTIIITTVAVRTLMLPFLINQNRFSARMGNMREELEEFNAETQAMRAKGAISSDQAHARTRQMKQMMEKHGVKFSHIFIYPVISMPIFATFFFALRSLHEKVPDFLTGGMYWFTNLAIPDPTFALPIITGVSMLLMSELSTEFASAQLDPKTAQTQKWVMRAFAVFVIPAMGTQIPSGVYLYWISTNLFSVIASFFITRPWMKKLLNIPPPNPKKVQTVQSQLLKSIESDKHAGQPEDSVMGKLGLAKKQPKTFVPYIPNRKIKLPNAEENKK